MPENESLLPDQAPMSIHCQITPRAARALRRLSSPENKKGDTARLISLLLVNEEAREEARRKTIRGALYRGGKRPKRKTPPSAA